VPRLESLEERLSPAASFLVKDINQGPFLGGANASSDPADLVVINGIAIFAATDDVHGRELWRSDGTAAGTRLLDDIIPGAIGSQPSQLTLAYAESAGGTFPTSAVSNVVYFTAGYSDGGWVLGSTNGTDVTLITHIPSDTGPQRIPLPTHLVGVNGTLFFEAGNSLWKLPAGSTDPVLYDPYAVVRAAASNNGVLYWLGSNQVGTGLLRATDLSAGSTVVAPFDSVGDELVDVNGTLYFAASNSNDGMELWKSNGTGASQVMDIWPGPDSSDPRQLTYINGTLFFTAVQPDRGRELWHYESSASSAGIVKDVFPGEESSHPDQLVDFDGTLLFTAAADETSPPGVWMSDGTASGTVPFTNPDQRAIPDLGSLSRGPVKLNGTLYYVGQGSLWRGDLTPAGTELVATFRSSPTFLTLLNNDILFAADANDRVGTELHRLEANTTITGSYVEDFTNDFDSSKAGYDSAVDGIYISTAPNTTPPSFVATSSLPDAGVGVSAPYALHISRNPNYYLNGSVLFYVRGGGPAAAVGLKFTGARSVVTFAGIYDVKTMTVESPSEWLLLEANYATLGNDNIPIGEIQYVQVDPTGDAYLDDIRFGIPAAGEFNVAPLAYPDLAIVPLDLGVSGIFQPQFNDIDPDVDALVVTAKSDPAHGRVEVFGDLGQPGVAFRYHLTDPNVTAADRDSFTYTISDGHGHSAIGTVNIAFFNQTQSYPGLAGGHFVEDFSADNTDFTNPGFDTYDYDPNTPTDGLLIRNNLSYVSWASSGLPSPASYEIAAPNDDEPTPPPEGLHRLKLQRGSVTFFVPVPGLTGSYAVDEQIDFINVQVSGVGTVQIAGVNGTVTRSFNSPAAYTTISASHDFHVAPDRKLEGILRLTVINPSDRPVLVDNVGVEIGLLEENRPPVAQNGSATVDPTTYEAVLQPLEDVEDPDGDPLHIVFPITQPTYGTVSTQDGRSFNYVLKPEFRDEPTVHDEFNYRVGDDRGGEATATVKIDYRRDRPPTAETKTYDLPHGFYTVFQPEAGDGVLSNASDPDGDHLTAALWDPPANGEVRMFSNGIFTYTTHSQWITDDEFTYALSDGIASPVKVRVVIHVANTSPVAVDVARDATLLHGTPAPITGSIIVQDADNDVLKPVVVDPPNDGSVFLQDDGPAGPGLRRITYSFTPFPSLLLPLQLDAYPSDLRSNHHFTYKLSDGLTDSNVATFKIGTFNNPPFVGSSDAIYVVYVGTPSPSPYVFQFNDDDTPQLVPFEFGPGDILPIGDADRTDTLYLLVESEPRHGVLQRLGNDRFTYIPDLNFLRDSLTMRVTDGYAISADVLTVSFTIFPYAKDDVYHVSRNGTLTVPTDKGVLRNDSFSGHDRTASADSLPGLKFNSDGAFTYTAPPGQEGVVSFSYTFDLDGIRSSNRANVRIVINDSDDDGVPDDVEQAAPPFPADHPVDPSQDRWIAALPNAVDGRYVFLVANAGELKDVRALPGPANLPAGVTLPAGLFSFELSGLTRGDSADVQVYLPPDVLAQATEYWKDTPNGYAPFPEADRLGDGFVLHLVDGGPGDRDGKANGVIRDPGGPAFLRAVSARVGGTIFLDFNADGRPDVFDPGLPGRTVFVDLNGNGRLDPAEPEAVTDDRGHYQLTEVPLGPVVLRQILDAGVVPTAPPGGSYTFTLAGGTDQAGVDFGNRVNTPAVPLTAVADLTGAGQTTDAATAFVLGLYRGVLGRDGEPEGIRFWLAQLAATGSRAEVAAGIWKSEEHRAAEVDAYYQTFLQRPSDAVGRPFWIQVFLSGADEAVVVQGFLTSVEYTATHAGDDAFVGGLYIDLLGRTGDDAGRRFWQDRLAAGVERDQVVAAFLRSRESVERLVDSLYAAYLQRPGEEGGRAFWQGELEQGTDPAAAAWGFLASDEFFARPGRTT
jgi:ELWxxDGT repeat protein